MDFFTNLWRTNKTLVVIIVFAICLGIYFLKKQSFYGTLNNTSFTNKQPESFPLLDEKVPGIFDLAKPDVPEEIGLAMVYPQGDGVGMDRGDSNSFYPDKPGPLLSEHTGPESYGESSLADPTGKNGADQGSRILKLTSTGDQLKYKPVEDSGTSSYAAAYSEASVDKGPVYINGATATDYSDPFNPERNLLLQTSPGQQSTLTNCEKTYPNVVKYNDFCITEGDIPYGQVVDGKVNPRLVSRWESFTGDYSREDVLQPIDGLLYPNLNVMTA